MLITLMSAILATTVFARAIGPADPAAHPLKEYSLIVLSALQEEAGITPPADVPSRKADDESQTKIDEKDETKSDVVAKKEEKSPEPVATPKPVATLSAGQKKIQEMMQKNREELQRLHGQTPTQGSGADIVSRLKKENQAGFSKRAENDADNDSGDLKSQYLRNLSKLKKQTKKTYAGWQEKTRETYAKWREKREDFLKNLPQYKQNTFSPQSFSLSSSDRGSLKTPSRLAKLKNAKKISTNDVQVIPEALEIPVRDQGRRPTCAAFAGVRALEVLMAGSGQIVDLSEQYFYWASKPECQSSPCSSRGSWVIGAFKNSQKSSHPDIPKESSCPYVDSSMPGNETQVPLSNTCQSIGSAGVQEFYPLSNLAQILESLNENIPVVGGFKLSPNFYTTTGLVDYQGRNSGGKQDAHAAGHALVIIGYMKLPSRMHASEGDICLIVANSWGEGWGAGGHACLTRKWFENYSIPKAFMALKTIKTP